MHAASLLFAFSFASLAFTALSDAPDVSLGETHIYKHADGQPLHLHTIKPPQWSASDERVAIVFFHGGGWVGGKVAQLEDQARHFAARGAVCFLVQYRFAPQDNVTPPIVCIQDARSALRWVRQHVKQFGVDAERIVAAGASAGGHLAAHAALVPAIDDPADDLSVSPRPDALILFNPVLDNGPGEFGTRRIGDRVAEFSPAHHVAPGAPPTILFLGTKDQLIPVATLERFRDAMRAAGARCELHLYEDQEHGFFNAWKSPEHYALTVQAADQFLQSLGWLPALVSETR